MAIEIFNQVSHKFKHCFSGFDHHAYKSEQRREVRKRVSAFFEENTKSKAIILALMSFEQDLMAIKIASNGYFMPIIFPNYLSMIISFEIIRFSLCLCP